jgi:hypothetical protein
MHSGITQHIMLCSSWLTFIPEPPVRDIRKKRFSETGKKKDGVSRCPTLSINDQYLAENGEQACEEFQDLNKRIPSTMPIDVNLAGGI